MAYFALRQKLRFFLCVNREFGDEGMFAHRALNDILLLIFLHASQHLLLS